MNPGRRAEHIAAGLGTDSKALRGPMKRLIEELKVKTRGERLAVDILRDVGDP
jgi:hypothetical protein